VTVSADDGLRGRVVRASAAAFLAQSLKLFLNLGVAIVLARLLTPEDFGLFGIAFSIAGFLEVAKDGGLIVPVVQTETLTPDQSSWLFWFNAAVGAALTIAASMVGLLAARVFGDARLVALMGALAFIFLFGGLSTQHRALMRRGLQFRTLAGCDVTAMAAGAALALYAAFQGAGYWSLVILFLAQEIVLTVLVWLVSGWRPGWPNRATSVRPLLRFGGWMMGFELVGYLNSKLDNLIVAYFLGAAALGFYDKAYQMLLLSYNQVSLPLSGVAHSVLSRLQSEPERYRTYLGRCILLSTGLGMPMVAFLFGNAAAVLELVFGPAWLPSAVIFQAFAPAAFLTTVTISAGWIAFSLGRARRQLRWTLATTAVTVLAFFCGVPWGASGVAMGLSVSRIALFVPTLIYTCAGTPVDWRWLVRIPARPAFAALVALVVSSAIATLLPPAWWRVFVDAAVYAAAYGLCWIATPGGRADLNEFWAAARTLYRNA
jgi:O-antigen/teichoic acid export membrane protein